MMESKSTEGKLTLFAVDTHANRSPLPGSNEARMMTATSGQSILDLYERLGLVGLLGKMFLATSTWGSMVCYLTWKEKVTPWNRLLFQLVPKTPTTEEIGYGLLPTPTASTGAQTKENPTPNQTGGTSIAGWVRMWPTVCARDWKGGRKPETLKLAGRNETNSLCDAINSKEQNTCNLSPEWTEALMGFPVGWTDLECDNPIDYGLGNPDDSGEPRVTVKSKGRAKRIKIMGNAVVPQIPEIIGRAIMEIENGK